MRLDDNRFDRVAKSVSQAADSDGMIHRLSRLLSRRSLVGGALGAALLAVGRGGGTQAQIVVEDCIPAGQRCGTGQKKRQCNRCCFGYHVVNAQGKKKCACRPAGIACDAPAQCCTGICEKRVCRSAPCRPADKSCDEDIDCCSGVCGAVTIFPPLKVSFCRKANCKQPGGECLADRDCCSELCFRPDSDPGVCEDP
jgi:hypothetical protein